MQDLTKFAQSMLSDSSKGSSSIVAGCTYIGQLITHDIVSPTKRNNDNLGRTEISWALNLDSIYGDLPKSGEFKYQKRDTDGKHFYYDFTRDKAFEANNSEKRNDENIIISQLHIFWMRLHNNLITQYGLTADQAKQKVILAFQLVVIHDFLYQTMGKKLFKRYFIENKTYLYSDILDTTGDTVPTFFSHASFRFGHSMINNTYKLGSHNENAKLHTLFRRNKQFNKKNVIDWSTFFYGQKTAAIDTHIADSMGRIPKKNGVTPEHIIPLLNLKASQNIPATYYLDKLKAQPNYSKILGECNLKPLLNADLEQASFNTQVRSIRELTLWPYILLEAQTKSVGSYLGALGAMLNAEVLKVAMQKSEISVFKYGGNDAVYSLPAVLSELGKFGCDLQNQHGLDASNTTTQTEIMKSLISFVQSGE